MLHVGTSSQLRHSNTSLDQQLTLLVAGNLSQSVADPVREFGIRKPDEEKDRVSDYADDSVLTTRFFELKRLSPWE